MFYNILIQVRSVRDVCNPNTGFTYLLIRYGKRLGLHIPQSTTVSECGSDDDEGVSPSKQSIENVTTNMEFNALKGERRFYKLCVHDKKAPFLIPLGESTWDGSLNVPQWQPRPTLDPRLYHIIRDYSAVRDPSKISRLSRVIIVGVVVIYTIILVYVYSCIFGRVKKVFMPLIVKKHFLNTSNR